ncbi:hypothetical protein PFICI_05485 [Pestalotiopsis fici W106-1]|uniref:Phenazine biosynthesis protein n=1 Tax=Pestalotiopsis fici (strain W106-1 / CGMCC3.15140) TaxID=1229662 RepID=W3XC56_PESFW|nr:uncharacterized protein PFICI_05485 [Pestalotiopsis fici W106-1]ETS83609.1 hypothetical protein PFICI_05485 [Pestalotiopsis fici W106-1]
MEFEFATLDVFTNRRLEGNPLAVVKVRDSQKDKLTQDLKQKIAKEFNLSETTFLHVPDGDVGKSTAPSALSVDIFTIESELPFAGHPTIGTAVLAKSLFPSVSTLNIKAGPIGLDPYNVNGRAFIRAKIPHNVHLHARTLADVIPAAQQATYEGLSHGEPQIRERELAAPVFSVVCGMTFVLVKLPSLELLGRVGRLRLDFDALPAPLLDVDSEWAPSFVARYYYVDVDDNEGEGAKGAGKVGGEGKQHVRKIRTRMVELGFEDPATGSAASCLASYLTLTEGVQEEGGAGASFEIVQGVEMGRRSEIRVDTTTETDGKGRTKIKDVYLGGEAVVVQKGTITVD